MADEHGSTFAIIAGGGTGGHLLPGLSVAHALVERGHAPSTIHFVGSNSGIEAREVPAAGFGLDELPGRGIQRKLTVANVAAAFGIVQALFRALRIVRRRRPKVVVALGGYASFACGLAAAVWRVPIVVLEQNKRAGAVNRIVGWRARHSAVAFDDTDLPRSVVTGNPLRPSLRQAAEHRDRDAARRALGLPADRIVIAVFAGSLGSRRINQAVRDLAARWSGRTDLAIRHVVGRRDYDDFAAQTPPVDGLVYQVVEYEDRMELLLSAADVAVTRAGGSVAELAAFGVPSVLVPLPIATRDHQTANARVFADAGAGVVVPDDELNVDRLDAELSPILTDASRRDTMARAMRAHAHLDAAERVAALVEECAAA